ncbi:hypothetical protein CCL24_20765 [Pseudomonas congelans]|nr:hypothetical protein CCL24_20765 [Pseudomonas congelans]
MFHVAWAQVLARCTGRDDVVFGTVVTGRLQGTIGAERAMGMFMNTLPVRVQLATQGAQELVAATHRDLSELLSHEQASLALAQRCSGMATAGAGVLQPAQLPAPERGQPVAMAGPALARQLRAHQLPVVLVGQRLRQ